MNLNSEILISVTYAIVSNPERDRFVAYSPHLKLAGFGKSAELAEEDFDRAVKCFIDFFTRNRNLNEKLIHLGWKKVLDKAPSPPKDWSIPSHLLQNNGVTRNKEYNVASAFC